MAWTLDDTLLITLKQRYLEQEIVNALTYVITFTGVGPDMPDIFTQFAAELTTQLATVQCDLVHHYEQRFDNITDILDFYVADITKNGDLASLEPAASFIAIGMKKAVNFKITRPGSIRIVGLTEAHMFGNSLTPDMQGWAETLGNYLGSVRTFVDSFAVQVSFTPVVVGRDEFGHFDLLRRNIVEDVISPRLTTQNSRKA